MRREAFVDLNILFRRFADEMLHPLDYPAALVSRFPSAMKDATSYELTAAGTTLFREWLNEQGIVYVNVGGTAPETREIPLGQIHS